MLIKVGQGLINPDNVAWVQDCGGYCIVYFTVGSVSANFQAGGSGHATSSLCNTTVQMSIDEFYALWNKEVALVHAMEKASDNN